jgi:hypothetical protein
MEESTTKKTEPTKEEQKPKQVAIPTQKTFSFNTLFNSPEKIDQKINKWLKDQTMKKQTPMLGKVSTTTGLFGKQIVYVFMFSTVFEIQLKKA